MDRNQLLSQLTLTVFQLNGKLSVWGDQFGRAEGLTTSRWQVLGAVALLRPAPTSPQVGDYMGMSRQAAQKQLNLLLQEGLVAQQPNPAHKRSVQYVLTEPGQAAFRQMNHRLNEKQNAKWNPHFSDEELETTLQTLIKLNQIINEDLQDENR